MIHKLSAVPKKERPTIALTAASILDGPLPYMMRMLKLNCLTMTGKDVEMNGAMTGLKSKTMKKESKSAQTFQSRKWIKDLLFQAPG